MRIVPSLSRFLLCLLAIVLPLVVVSCQRKDSLNDEGGTHIANLVLSVGGFPQMTKVDAGSFKEVNPEAPFFRGMTDVKLIPFSQTGTIVSSNRANTYPIEIPSFYSLLPEVDAYYYSKGVNAWFPIGTSSFLLYGRAPGDGSDETKVKYGSLVPVGFDGKDSFPQALNLGFNPDPRYSGTQTPEVAGKIAAVLNVIMLGNPTSVNAYYGTEGKYKQVYLNWNENIGDSSLKEAFKQITNDGALMPGSGLLVESLLSSLYGMLSNYESHNSNVYEVEVGGTYYQATKDPEGTTPLLYKDLYDALCDDLLTRFRKEEFVNSVTIKEQTHTITFKDPDWSSYPESLGLPSGCAVLRWTPAGFVVPLVSGVEGIAPLNRYCYPPALYYYCNTTIRTSMDEDIDSAYEGAEKWADVLERYNLGTSISSHTTSVALENPAQFAVGMLSATVKAPHSWLQDNDGLPETTIDAVEHNLPITGIVLGGQYAQKFDFTPKTGQEEEYYIYDNEIPDVYLTVNSSKPIRTLSLQTPDNKDVYFTLEFRNDSGKTFYGADGRVLPGRKFYMVGKLEMPENPAFPSVFVKGHYTKVECTINSLAGAYNAVPDIGNPQLVVGIQTQVNWILSSPSTVMLE